MSPLGSYCSNPSSTNGQASLMPLPSPAKTPITLPFIKNPTNILSFTPSLCQDNLAIMDPADKNPIHQALPVRNLFLDRLANSSVKLQTTSDHHPLILLRSVTKFTSCPCLRAWVSPKYSRTSADVDESMRKLNAHYDLFEIHLLTYLDWQKRDLKAIQAPKEGYK